MAQLGLVILFSKSVPGGRVRVCIPSFSDNTGAEASCNKLLTTASPLCYFTQQLALVSWRCGVVLDVQHIAGYKNDDADYLSHWDGAEPLREKWNLDFRVCMPVERLWESVSDVRVFPACRRAPLVAIALLRALAG